MQQALCLGPNPLIYGGQGLDSLLISVISTDSKMKEVRWSDVPLVALGLLYALRAGGSSLQSSLPDPLTRVGPAPVCRRCSSSSRRPDPAHPSSRSCLSTFLGVLNRDPFSECFSPFGPEFHPSPFFAPIPSDGRNLPPPSLFPFHDLAVAGV